jgi:diaminopimelate decarboxylase
MATTIDTTTAAALAAAPTADTGKAKSGSWFEAMADAWGKTLNDQANNIADLSLQVGSGQDNPEAITKMTSESMRFGFLTTASHTAISSAGEGLKTMAQKS